MNNIIQELRELPEVRLKIVPLAWQLMDGNGELDMAKAAEAIDEVNAAGEEAEAYVKETHKAVECLKNMDRSYY